MDIRVWILVLVFLYYFILNNQAQSKTKLVWFSCFLLAMQSGLRHIVVGSDTAGYYGTFISSARHNWADALSGLFVSSSEFRDPGFKILCKAFATIIPSWQIFLVALALLYFYGLGKLWDRYIRSKEGVLLAVTLCLTLFNVIALSGIRQQITMSLAFLLIPLIEEKRWKIVVPVILIGALIHISFLFMLAFIPLQYIRRDNSKSLLVFAIFFIPIIAKYSRNIIAFMASQLENDYYKGYATSSGQGSPLTYIGLCSLISIFLLYNYNKLKDAPKVFTSSVILMTLTVPLIVLDGTMIRIGQYFTIYMMITLPWVLDKIRGSRFYIYLFAIILLVYLGLKDVFEYYFFWENSPDLIFNVWGID